VTLSVIWSARGFAHAPLVSLAYMGESPSLPTAVQFPTLVQLTPVNDPGPLGTSVGVPQALLDSVSYIGWLLLSPPTAVQLPTATQLTPAREPVTTPTPDNSAGDDQLPPAAAAAIGLPLPSTPTAVQALEVVQLTPANEAGTPVRKVSWVVGPHVPAVSMSYVGCPMPSATW